MEKVQNTIQNQMQSAEQRIATNPTPENAKEIQKLAADLGLDGNNSKVQEAIINTQAEVASILNTMQSQHDPSSLFNELQKYQIDIKDIEGVQQKVTQGEMQLEQRAEALIARAQPVAEEINKNVKRNSIIGSVLSIAAGVAAFKLLPSRLPEGSKLVDKTWKKVGASLIVGFLTNILAKAGLTALTIKNPVKKLDAFAQEKEGIDTARAQLYESISSQGNQLLAEKMDTLIAAKVKEKLGASQQVTSAPAPVTAPATHQQATQNHIASPTEKIVERKPLPAHSLLVADNQGAQRPIAPKTLMDQVKTPASSHSHGVTEQKIAAQQAGITAGV